MGRNGKDKGERKERNTMQWRGVKERSGRRGEGQEVVGRMAGRTEGERRFMDRWVMEILREGTGGGAGGGEAEIHGEVGRQGIGGKEGRHGRLWWWKAGRPKGRGRRRMNV